MKGNYEKLYHMLEYHHWWFRGRRSAILENLKSIPNKKSLTVLDIGCSIGLLILELEAMGFDGKRIFGIDISKKAIQSARSNKLSNVCVMDAQAISFKENQFDIIISSDCLEHVEKDSVALENWYRLLKPDGKLIVYVPAFMSLWSSHDEANMHYRRYTRAELSQKMERTGIIVEKKSYWNFFLFCPIWVVRKINNLLKKKEDVADAGDISMPPPSLNSLFLMLINIENKLVKFLSFPIGVSLFVIGKKPRRCPQN